MIRVALLFLRSISPLKKVISSKRFICSGAVKFLLVEKSLTSPVCLYT